MEGTLLLENRRIREFPTRASVDTDFVYNLGRQWAWLWRVIQMRHSVTA